MNIAIHRSSGDHGVGGHMVCAWLQEQLPWATLEWLDTFTPTPKHCEARVLMGDAARRISCIPIDIRDMGYVIHSPIPTVATYDIEAAWHFTVDKENEDDNTETDDEYGGARVQHKNELFWIRSDICKLRRFGGRVQSNYENYTLAPHLEKLCACLLNLQDSSITIDIETNREDQTLSCIGVKPRSFPCAVVPVYDYRGDVLIGRTRLFRFFQALAKAMSRNLIIGHNIGFDLAVLAGKYLLPFGTKICDTMLMHHRVFPEVEKSLGHALRCWVNHPWHKHMNVGNPHNSNQQAAHWKYNALDVLRTEELFLTLQRFGKLNPPYALSMHHACEQTYPYLVMTLKGMSVDYLTLAKKKLEVANRTKALQRVCRILTGDPKFNPGSSSQCSKFLHTKLGYPVVARTKEGAPALGSKQLMQLAVKYNNPLLRAIIAYRGAQKEEGILNFKGLKLPLQ